MPAFVVVLLALSLSLSQRHTADEITKLISQKENAMERGSIPVREQKMMLVEMKKLRDESKTLVE